MRPDLAITIFTQKALKNETIPIFGDGKKTRDFTYISNIVDGNLKIMERGSGEYNFGCCQSTSIQELAEKIIAITDSKSDIEYSGAVKGDAMHTLASIDRARKEIGYEPTVSLDEGLERYVEWHRENRLDKLKI
jgi:UDP-glucose 4-epimerase